jgi:hypothetical protein
VNAPVNQPPGRSHAPLAVENDKNRPETCSNPQDLLE